MDSQLDRHLRQSAGRRSSSFIDLVDMGDGIVFAAHGQLEQEAQRVYNKMRVHPPAIGKEDDMARDTVAQMTQSELKEMLEAVVETTVEEKLLEILGDPDEGLGLREAVRDRLIRQREAVASGQYGQAFEDVVKELGLE